MIFEPVFEGGLVIRAEGFDEEARDLLEMQPGDVANGVGAANEALRRGEVTEDDLRDLSSSPPAKPWATFTRFIMQAARLAK